jgi:hypothetical protein
VRSDLELVVHVAQLVLHGLRCEKELGSRLAGGQAVGKGEGDLELLRGQAVAHSLVARTRALVYGERLRRARQRREAWVHLVAALEAFDRLGASPGFSARSRSSAPRALWVAILVGNVGTWM